MSTRTAVGAAPGIVAAHGLRVMLPHRWEARLFLRDREIEDDESVSPVLHLANFALPPARGDFGSGAVDVMGPAHAFVALLEYDAGEAGRGLFGARGMPRPALHEFASNALQRPQRSQVGYQSFFTESRRPFCLYVVLGSRSLAAQLVGEVHRVLDRIEVAAR